MKKVKEILGGIWKLYVFIWFTLLLLLLYPFYLMFLLNEKHFNKGFRLLRFHTGLLMYLSGIIVSVKNRHYIKKGQPYVITPNHSSFLDIIILYQTFPQYFVFMGKKSLATIPIFSIFFKKMNITVDRRSARDGKRSVDRCGLELDKGHSVVMFPEGTISANVPEMLKFKNGAFKLAIEKQVPIIPITFFTNHKRLEMAGLFSGKAGPGIAKAVIHEPIPTKGMTEEDLVPLRDKVYKIINDELLAYTSR
ncbi:MAG: 1-acyl-sn-glycerol-3-phosphate acyltransferase [Flavobacteriales bacterium]|nr:1-acyl-sn-glycerol-3-phosphate acyltransferase [Flavobacteriales bacterium]